MQLLTSLGRGWLWINEGKLALIAFARLLSTVLHAVVPDDLFGREARGGRCLLPATVFASLPLLPGYSRPWPPPFSDTHASLLAYFSSVYSSCGGGGVYSLNIHTIVHTLRNCGGCFSVAPQLLLLLLIYFPLPPSPASWLPCATQLKSSP